MSTRCHSCVISVRLLPVAPSRRAAVAKTARLVILPVEIALTVHNQARRLSARDTKAPYPQLLSTPQASQFPAESLPSASHVARLWTEETLDSRSE